MIVPSLSVIIPDPTDIERSDETSEAGARGIPRTVTTDGVTLSAIARSSRSNVARTLWPWAAAGSVSAVSKHTKTGINTSLIDQALFNCRVTVRKSSFASNQRDFYSSAF
jgi:hypothetical protein